MCGSRKAMEVGDYTIVCSIASILQRYVSMDIAYCYIEGFFYLQHIHWYSRCFVRFFSTRAFTTAAKQVHLKITTINEGFHISSQSIIKTVGVVGMRHSSPIAH